MNHIVVDFRPFTMSQNVMVYVDGECKETIGAGLDDIVPVVNALRTKYNIDQVDMCGNADFLSKYKKELMTTQYGNVNVDIIER